MTVTKDNRWNYLTDLVPAGKVIIRETPHNVLYIYFDKSPVAKGFVRLDTVKYTSWYHSKMDRIKRKGFETKELAIEAFLKELFADAL